VISDQEAQRQRSMSPASPSAIRFPGYPAASYCESCGLSSWHWSGCPEGTGNG